MERSYNRRALAATAAMVGAGVLACGAVVGRYHQQTALEQFMLVPVNGPMLFSHPGGMPDTGYSGRANNLEDYTDPYGGGDVPGPYGYANDPYDGDWALGPLGGKGIQTQNLRFVDGFQNRRAPAQAPVRNGRMAREDEPNVWGSEPMGTDSLFMPRLTASDIKHGEEAHKAAMKKQLAAMGGKKPEPVPDWVGTNTAFFGAHQGGDSSFTHQPQAAKGGHGHFKKAQHGKGRKMKMAHTQQLFRSDDPHLAEYGFEGDNQLNEDVLPSDIGSGGPVIGVDGEPSNVDHEWVHVEEPFSFSCNPDILGCEEGLEVDPDYANDLRGVDYQ
jgi:hypothetical protein